MKPIRFEQFRIVILDDQSFEFLQRQSSALQVSLNSVT